MLQNLRLARYCRTLAMLPLLLLCLPAGAAEIRVMLTSAFSRPYDALIPAFEKASGHKVVTSYALPPALVQRMDAGEAFDVMVLSYDVEGLIRQGKLQQGSRTVFGRSGVGVAIRAGSPKPEFNSVEAFKRSLLAAKTIGTSGEGSSGRFVAGLIERLGIAEQVRPKIRSGGPGESARMLARGDVDFVVSGLPPLLGTPNIQWLGYIPAEIQSWVVFSGGLNARLNADAAEPARALLRHLTSTEAVKLYQENGIDPVTP